MHYLNSGEPFKTRKEILDEELEKIILMEEENDTSYRKQHQYLPRNSRFLQDIDLENYKTWFYEDSFGAPVGKDNFGVDIYKIASVAKIPEHCFTKKAEYSILLPPITQEIAKFAHSSVKSILLKKNIIEENRDKHPEISNNKLVLDNAIYHTLVALYNKPESRSSYYVAVGFPYDHYAVSTLDFDSSKKYIEIVDWRSVSLDTFDRMVKNSVKSGGDIHFLAREP